MSHRYKEAGVGIYASDGAAAARMSKEDVKGPSPFRTGGGRIDYQKKL
jgi:hypothetical protein